MAGEPTLILRRPRRLPKAAAVVELEAQEVSEQHGTVEVGRPAEEVFDQRAAAATPGGLEPVARLVHIARDSGRIKLVISPRCYVHADPSRSERCRSNVLEAPGAVKHWRVAAWNWWREPKASIGSLRMRAHGGAGAQPLISLAHILRIRASLRRPYL